MTDVTGRQVVDAATLTERRAQLEAERAHLLDQAVASLGDEELDPEDPSKGRDAVVAGLESLQRDALEDVEDALARLDDGTYGSCTDCGDAIPPERLEVMPATRFCVSCRQRNE